MRREKERLRKKAVEQEKWIMTVGRKGRVTLLKYDLGKGPAWEEKEK